MFGSLYVFVYSCGVGRASCIIHSSDAGSNNWLDFNRGEHVCWIRAFDVRVSVCNSERRERIEWKIYIQLIVYVICGLWAFVCDRDSVCSVCSVYATWPHAIPLLHTRGARAFAAIVVIVQNERCDGWCGAWGVFNWSLNWIDELDFSLLCCTSTARCMIFLPIFIISWHNLSDT